MGEAVGRLQNYLAARRKKKQLDKAWIHWINQGEESQAELRSEDIEKVLKQRAELLDALKEMWDAHESQTSGGVSKIVLEAISNAEK